MKHVTSRHDLFSDRCNHSSEARVPEQSPGRVVMSSNAISSVLCDPLCP